MSSIKEQKKETYVLIPKRFVERMTELSSSDVKVLLAISYFRHGLSGMCNPSMPTLKKISGIKSTNTLRKSIHNLVKKKFIIVEYLDGRGCNRYWNHSEEVESQLKSKDYRVESNGYIVRPETIRSLPPPKFWDKNN